MENVPSKIIVHHDGVSRDGPSLKIVDDFHRGRGFPLSSFGYFVGYHYWIERDGSLYQTRDEKEEGAHTVGENLSSIGIGLAGNFDAELPTKAQVVVLGILLSDLRARYKIPYGMIYPHRRFAQKSCFGSKLPDSWAAIVCIIHDLTEQGV